MRIAVVGAGVSGLVAAHFLSKEHEVFVFEKESWAGGHACTVTAHDEAGQEVPVDIGFLVYNERTYPVFTKILRAIGAPTRPSEMSLSVTCLRCQLQYASHNLTTVLGLPHRFPPWQHTQMLLEILRFHRLANAYRNRAQAGETLGDFFHTHRFSDVLLRHYVGPMTAAIWSAPPGAVRHFPLALFLEFMHNHGLLRVYGQPRWRTIDGGSREYVRRLIRPFAERLYLNAPVRQVVRRPWGVELHVNGSIVRADKVVFALHADQALRILADTSPQERRALESIKYQANEIVLHTDTRMLPHNRALWASWNYHTPDCHDESKPLAITYNLNRLQRLRTNTTFCVTLNCADRIDPQRIIGRWTFDHPQYTPRVPHAQNELRALRGERHTYFCGAYLGYGFHEDGARSGFEVAHLVTRERAAA